MNPENIVYFFILISFLHFVGDFVCQTDKMAKGKSSKIGDLLDHVAVYGTVLLVGLAAAYWIMGFMFYENDYIDLTELENKLLSFAVANTMLHFVTDFFTSKINKWLYTNSTNHNFFIGVGFDQFLHMLGFLVTFKLILL